MGLIKHTAGWTVSSIKQVTPALPDIPIVVIKNANQLQIGESPVFLSMELDK